MTPLERLSKEAAFDSLKERSPISFDEFNNSLKGWEIFPVVIRNDVVGAILRKKNEIHACIKPIGFGHWFNKFALGILEETIKKYGFATTAVKAGNLVGDKFVRRLAFKFIKEENGNWFYAKE